MSEGSAATAARFMRGDFFDFEPRFKLFIVGNHKPRLDNVDEAMRRRLLLVPFTVQIPPEERDPELPHKLEAEWPAILRWALDGCGEWRRIGLCLPDVVTAATEAYFADQHVTQQWFDDCVQVTAPTCFLRTSETVRLLEAVVRRTQLRPGSMNTLSDALYERGFERARDSRGNRGFRGLTIKTSTQSYD
jgi:putative DNA primase/helicase